jgi:hypothetical protein
VSRRGREEKEKEEEEAREPLTTSVLDYKKAFEDALTDMVARGMIFADPRLPPQKALDLATDYVASLEAGKHLTVFVPLNVPEGLPLVPVSGAERARGTGQSARRSRRAGADTKAEKGRPRKKRPRWLGDGIL